MEEFIVDCNSIRELITDPKSLEDNLADIKIKHANIIVNIRNYYNECQKRFMNEIYTKVKKLAERYAIAEIVKKDVESMEFGKLYTVPVYKYKLPFDFENDFNDDIYDELLEVSDNTKKYFKRLQEFDSMIEDSKNDIKDMTKFDVDKYVNAIDSNVLPIIYHAHISYVQNVKKYHLEEPIQVKWKNQSININLPQQKFIDAFLKQYLKI